MLSLISPQNNKILPLYKKNVYFLIKNPVQGCIITHLINMLKAVIYYFMILRYTYYPLNEKNEEN